MRIIWDDSDQSFVAEFSSSHWAEDKDSVHVSGFRTSGPPEWKWFTKKISVLDKLKKSASGIMITEAALQKYNSLKKKHEDKTALKKQFKTTSKNSLNSEVSHLTDLIIPEGRIWISKEDLPEITVVVKMDYKKLACGGYCFICGDPLYSLDYSDICLWCDRENNCKNVLTTI